MVSAMISAIGMISARLNTTGDTSHIEHGPPRSPPGQRRLASLADYADPTRCHADPLCLRVHSMEPTMPIAPKLADGVVNPCIETKDGLVCLPAVHLIGGWHMFAKEALSFLHQIKLLDTSHDGSCFDDWGDDSGGRKWVQQWGSAPAAGTLKVATCYKLLGWYPAFAGRYTSAWGKEYGACKERELHKPGDYYAERMWPICRPAAMRAHDAAMGSGGVGREATPPFVMSTLYGPGGAKVISVLRHPVDRLETSFWSHVHYPKKYGASPQGLHAYVAEQTAAFDECGATHGVRRCAFLFELLEPKYGDIFFHCDQIIRGVYEPFLREWHAALADGLLVLRVEDLLDRHVQTRRRLLDFLGLQAVDGAALPAPEAPYAALHARSLLAAKAQPMLPATRVLAERFYAPHNQGLSTLLADPSLTWPRGSTAVDAAGIANARAL